VETLTAKEAFRLHQQLAFFLEACIRKFKLAAIEVAICSLMEGELREFLRCRSKFSILYLADQLLLLRSELPSSLWS
jgi:hypothetical protein